MRKRFLAVCITILHNPAGCGEALVHDVAAIPARVEGDIRLRASPYTADF